ncbi:MAG TPA: bestrophin family ion channel [Dyella sp.]|uniref:bestrophin family protein n=1 Tax=Dyella sp. TaxID=1869338 RepID=UPI002C41708E|nr:bestrophin family ion channel [Dyella sp.]HTV84792.1 bestrophin family ion channel [Dyella sp.]
MIVRPRPNWFRLLLVVRGSVLPMILPQLLLTLAFSLAVTLLHGHVFVWKVSLTFVPFSLIGLTLAIFLGFRNNTSYARYWEARVLWGEVLNDARSLARQSLTLVDAQDGSKVFVHRLIAFVHALRHQLRGTDPQADLARWLSADDLAGLHDARYKASAILLLADQWLRDRRLDGQLAAPLAQAMQLHMGHLSDALGGCERIASTPIPFTYGVIIHRTVYLYCLLLPFGLVDSIGAMTPLVVTFIAYTFFALEALSSEIEEPFGTAPNDLPLDAMSEGIETSLRELLGERNLPAPPPPHNYILT